MKGLRLLLTTDSVGGVWQYSLDLARALVPHRVHTLLAHMGPAPRDSQHMAALAIPHLTFLETGLPLDWLCDGPAPVLRAGEWIAEIARQSRADIVQLNMPSLGAMSRYDMPVVAVSHGCVATWWAAAKAEPLAEAWRWHEALMRAGYANADAVVAPSAAYAAVVAGHYRLPQPVAVVPNGRTALPGGMASRGGDAVLTVGRLWDPVKNAALLDRVAAQLTVPFHAAGASMGPHGESVALQHLHRLGELDEDALGAWLAARPVFVSAARFEPFGLAVLEAAAAGCPLVLSDIATFRELWDGAALFVAPDDEAGFVAAIEALTRDAMLAAQLGSAARSRAGRYTPAATAAAMHELYRRLTTGRRVAA